MWKEILHVRILHALHVQEIVFFNNKKPLQMFLNDVSQTFRNKPVFLRNFPFKFQLELQKNAIKELKMRNGQE